MADIQEDEKLLTVRVSHNDTTGSFFIDFWDNDTKNCRYIISIKVSEIIAVGTAKSLGIKVMIR